MTLWLLLSIGATRCAMPAREVVRVVPRARLHNLAGVPDFIAGRLIYQGQQVPVLDLCQLVLGRPCQPVYSTRIVLVDYPYRESQTTLLGLQAERVTQAVRRDSEDFQACTLDQGRFLGAVSTSEEGVIQALKVAELIPQELRDCLFTTTETPS